MNISINNNNNNKFLSVLVIMAVFVAIFVPTTVEAAGSRGSVRHRRSDEKEDNRMLKSSKNGNNANKAGGSNNKFSKGGATMGTTAGTSVSATTSSITVGTPTTTVTTTGTSVNTVSSWEARCASESNILDNCVGTAKMALCKQCILGIATLSTNNMSGLNSCSNVNINGGMCTGDCKPEVLTFYNCGAKITSLSNPANSPSSITQQVTSGVQVTAPPPVSTVGVILPTFTNLPDCPATKPGVGVGCTKNRRCKYFENDALGNPIAIRNCDCDGDGVFFCRNPIPIFQPAVLSSF